MTRNESGPRQSSFRRRSIFLPMASIISGTNGGLTSNEPSFGLNALSSKKDPIEPNLVSTSGNAEQNLSYRQLKGEAKHSMVEPSPAFVAASKAIPGTAH
mmetsp:Transcript_24361/g.29969  ORF Transcript_24361/g.29969 Transcript_24361/m.29969 type:complete len:100 (+) Transcript_24361:1094-1393(+)